jgi:3-methyladenine DNA glycosylase AlkD
MNQQQIITKLRQELKKKVEPKYRDDERRFFREKIKNYGVRMQKRRKIAQELFKEIKDRDKEEIWKVCERLLKSGYNEEATVAFSWIYKIKNQYEKKDFKVFERWVKQYADNWAKVDDFCTHAVGHLINQYPELIKQLSSWTKSKNRWARRAAAVSLIHPFGKKKQYLPAIFKTAKELLRDKDDMVQKGYGWMLKETSNHNQKEVFEWVMKHKNQMPRTALRYAIEKMPDKMRKRAMAKG